LFGNLKDKPVVINMSLVIPADSEAVNAGIDPAQLALTRQGLLKAIQALTDSSVVFVASAGNEGDLRYTPMNPTGERPDALYPAAYAYNGLTQPEMMIPVGAINSIGKAASYSCYPGPLGVATYGGEVPAKSDIKTVDHVTHVSKIDGMIGIYSALHYPALSVDDRIANYPVPNAHGWAYWVGTSFATPIISALAARVLEAKERGTLALNTVVQQTIIAQGATRQVNWDRLNALAHGNVDTLVGSVVWAEQKCKPTKVGHDEDEDEEVEINLTEIHVDEVNIIEA
jgi:subtilisin family serine protease